MNETVTEIPKDSTEATKSREAQAREIVKHADEQPHTSLKEKLESALDNTIGAGTTDKVSGTAKEMLGKVEERVGELKEETQEALDKAAEALNQAAEAAKKIIL